MTTKDEALQMALEAMQQIHPDYHLMPGRLGPQAALLNLHIAISACREALAQKDEQEPFGYWHAGDTEEESDFFLHKDSGDVRCVNCVPIYTAPPKRQPLTDDRIREIADNGIWVGMVFANGTKGIALDKVTVCDFARAIEKAHGIGVEHD